MEMDSVVQQTDTIHIGDLQPGMSLIDTHQGKEKVIRQVEPHAMFVQLFFENDDAAFTCSIQELQSRLSLYRMLFAQMPI